MLWTHWVSIHQGYDERFAAKYGFWRPIVERLVKAFLKCGHLHEGFARVHCPDCHHEMFVAFSCKQRCTCPSCHQKRALLTSIHVAQEVCAPVAHRQVVLTSPQRLRLHTRFDFSLSRLVKVSAPGQVVYKAEQGACRAFSGPQHEGLASEPTRNFQILGPLICPRCSGQMKIVAFMEPPQAGVIEKILKPLIHEGFQAMFTSMVRNQFSYRFTITSLISAQRATSLPPKLV